MLLSEAKEVLVCRRCAESKTVGFVFFHSESGEIVSLGEVIGTKPFFKLCFKHREKMYTRK